MTQSKKTSPRFKNKVVIVTGAAQGIGRGVALQIAKESGRVVLVDHSDYVDDVAQEIKALGGKAITIKADLETFVGACAVAEKTIKKYKKN